jgi:hypothetical protein
MLPITKFHYAVFSSPLFLHPFWTKCAPEHALINHPQPVFFP